jgi:predicted nucleotide-binding protein
MPDSPSVAPSILATGIPNPTRNPRQVFVAYSYRLYDKADYRKVYTELEKAFNVKFVFADEKITNLHILQKIVDFIRSSRFGIYDISGWNPNVTLELGLAFGLNEKAYIAIDPSKTPIDEVPADLRGIDRIQYNSFTSLGEGIGRLLAQEVPVQPTHEVENQLTSLRAQAKKLVEQSEGLRVVDIAKLLGVSVDMAKVVVGPMIGTDFDVRGKTRAARYYIKGKAPE